MDNVYNIVYDFDIIWFLPVASQLQCSTGREHGNVVARAGFNHAARVIDLPELGQH